jgi:hypothetical protein
VRAALSPRMRACVSHLGVSAPLLARRMIGPGTMVTMDHRPDRLNICFDERGVITRVYKG